MNPKPILGALAIVALGCSGLVAADVARNHTRVAEAGSPYLNGQYWPNWAYLPLSTLPAYNCTTYDVSAGIAAWNNTGLVSIGSPISTSDCSGNDRVVFVYGDPEDYCAVCEGYVWNWTIYRTVRNPETGAVGFNQIYRSAVCLKPGLSQLGPRPSPTSWATSSDSVTSTPGARIPTAAEDRLASWTYAATLRPSSKT